MPHSILVTDGEQRPALAVVRSLGRAGHRVTVCASRPHGLAATSRFCRAAHVVPDPLQAPEQFRRSVEALVREREIACVLPVTEASLLALLPEAGGTLAGAVVPFPDAAHFRDISNKRLVLDAARALGIAVPAQVAVSHPAELAALDLDALGTPVVVKPSRSVVDGRDGGLKMSVSYAADRRALEALLGSLDARAFPVLLQQQIRGPGVGVFLLRWHGQLLARFAHRRLREKPPSGGVSVYSESVRMDDAMLEQAAALLERFAWNGVAMVEFKRDSATGVPYLMEINGRFWGSLQLAIDAGVDFPALLVAAACGEHPAPVLDYRIGTRLRWWWGDVDHLLLRLRHPPARWQLRGADGARWRAVRDFLAAGMPGGHSRNEVFRWSDPRPALRETLDWFRRR